MKTLYTSLASWRDYLYTYKIFLLVVVLFFLVLLKGSLQQTSRS